MFRKTHRQIMRKNASAVNSALTHFWKCDDGIGTTLADSVDPTTKIPSNMTITAGSDFTSSGAGKLTTTGVVRVLADVEGTLQAIGDNPFLFALFCTAVSGTSSVAIFNSFIASTDLLVFGQQGFNVSSIADGDSIVGSGAGMSSDTGMYSIISNNVTGKVFTDGAQVGTDMDLSGIDSIGVAIEEIALNGLTDLMGISLHVFDGSFKPSLETTRAYAEWLGTQWSANNKVTDPLLWF